MHNSLYFEKRELKYLNRKQRMDKDFEWTKDVFQKLLKLNNELSEMQNTLSDEIKSAYELFTKLEKSGMSFLHGFKVIGNFAFEKEIATKLYELDNPTKAQRAIIDKWDNIYWFSSDEIEAWQIVFDSLTGDFMPLSKTRLNQKETHCRDLNLPQNEDIDFCSYLSHFIKYNKTFSNQDLSELTIKDFSPVVKVVLNYEVSEFEGFSSCYPYRNADSDSIYSMLDDRCRTLNKTFEWTKKNIQKIMDVNSCLWKRTDEMKKELTVLNEVFKSLSSTTPKFKYYSLEGQIEYHGSEANDIATMELQKELRRRAAFHYWTLNLDENNSEIRDSIHEDENLNWNFEVYRPHLSEVQQKVKFHYFMHTVFVDDNIYSFEDLVRMREEDFKICFEINWYGD
jgi:hypothetical protein